MEENLEEIIVEAVEAAGVNGDLDLNIEQELNNLANNPNLGASVPNLQGNSIIRVETDEHNVLQEFAQNIKEAASLFTAYNKCLRLIEISEREDFQYWEKLTECIDLIALHPRVSEKMKMRCLLINKDNVRTFSLLQSKFKLDLDNIFYMGKMNLLHISCDTGWANLTRELINETKMNVNTCCPSVHMRPSSLTPLMLAAAAGHLEVVKVLLDHPDTDMELKDSYGMTAVFHTCNHGTNRVGDQYGYFRRLWSWDLSQEQINNMEGMARSGALPIIRLMVQHGVDLSARDKTGASILTRASSVENFHLVVKFLIEAGCKVTENILNWTRIRNERLVKQVEQELKTPNSLIRQARLVIWKQLRNESSPQLFRKKMCILEREECLPSVLQEYLLCLN